MKQVVCNVLDSGAVEVEIKGSHISKRELQRLLKAISLEHKNRIREFRRQQIIKEHERKTNERTEPRTSSERNPAADVEDQRTAAAARRKQQAVSNAARGTTAIGPRKEANGT